MKLTDTDFLHLFDTAMQWNDAWKVKADRFEEEVSYSWAWAYWFERYGDTILAKHFLTSEGFKFEVTFDSGTDSWLLLTDYSFEAFDDDKAVANA